MLMLTKAARDSKTLRFNWLATIVTGAAALVPTILSYALAALGDPQIAAAVAELVPAQYRTLLFLVVAFVAQRNAALRYQTSTPIHGSAGAVALEARMTALGNTAAPPADGAKE